jgi:hypothetical protein
MWRAGGLLVLSVSLAGCKRREPAPTEMTDLVRYTFLHWEEDELLPEAMDNLQRWLADNIDSEQANKGFELPDLSAEDVADVQRPDRDLALMIGATGAAPSPFPLSDHAATVVLDSQLFSNPDAYDSYVRHIEGDTGAFADGSGLVRTRNEITTTTLGITIPYVMIKDYRWVEGESSRSILARSWVEERFCNEGGGSCLEQTFSVDVFFDEDGSTWRMTAAWNEITSTIPLPDATRVATLAIGIQDVFRSTDEFLAGEQE